MSANASGTSKQMAQGMADTVKDLASNSNVQIFLVVLSMLLIIFVTIYIVKLFKQNNLKQVDLTDKVIDLSDRSVIPFAVEGSKLSLDTRGQEFSYSIWLFVKDNYVLTQSHKLVFERGNSVDNTGAATPVYSGCTPIVALHGSTNKLMVAVYTDKSTSRPLPINDVFDPSNKYLISSIDYLPLQRWVNVVLVVRDHMLMIFLDGDVYSITTTSDIPNAADNRPIIPGAGGNATIGTRITPINGFVSKFQYFNYGMTQHQIGKIYTRGPVTKSFLSYFGIGNYGVRSPIYQIEEDAKN